MDKHLKNFVQKGQFIIFVKGYYFCVVPCFLALQSGYCVKNISFFLLFNFTIGRVATTVGSQLLWAHL